MDALLRLSKNPAGFSDNREIASTRIFLPMVQKNQNRCYSGKRSERCLWQMKRGERVAAVKISAA